MMVQIWLAKTRTKNAKKYQKGIIFINNGCGRAVTKTHKMETNCTITQRALIIYPPHTKITVKRRRRDWQICFGTASAALSFPLTPVSQSVHANSPPWWAWMFCAHHWKRGGKEERKNLCYYIIIYKLIINPKKNKKKSQFLWKCVREGVGGLNGGPIGFKD